MKPLFVIGAPRSGTTFFTTALNSHPQVFVTNELRAWNYIALSSVKLAGPSELLPEHPLREDYAQALLRGMVTSLREFYADKVNKTNLGCPTPGNQHYYKRIEVFGDKNPGYVDRNNTNCLPSMRQLMPDARYIHVHRDPRSCVASYLRISVYPDDLDVAIDMWKRHIEPAIEFCQTLNADEFRVVKYEDFVTEKGDAIFRDLETFLHIDDAPAPLEFLAAERRQRTPYRSPSTPREDLGGTTFDKSLSIEAIRHIEQACASHMEALGYSRYKQPTVASTS